MKLRIGIPKGSLQEATLQLFARAGLPAYTNGRSYFATTADPEIDCMLIRAQEMARYVEHGAIDAGLTGHRLGHRKRPRSRHCQRPDLRQAQSRQGPLGVWPLRTIRRSSVLKISPARLSPPNWSSHSQLFPSKNVNVQVEFSWGATEVKPPCWPMPSSKSPRREVLFAPTGSAFSKPYSSRTRS